MARKILPKRRASRDTPPKIVYLIGLLAYAVWIGWAYILFYLSPAPIYNRLLFLGTLSLALFLTFLFLFYEIGKISTGKAPSIVFYPAVRRAFITVIFFVTSAIMQLFDIANWINVGLLGIVLLLTEVQVSRG